MMSLEQSWQRLWHGLGATVNGLLLQKELLARYQEPHRQYHTLQHLTECLDLFGQVAQLAVYPAEVEAALWFHDAIYETDRQDNEAQSAHWANSALTQAGVSQVVVDRIVGLILATKHTTLPILPDQQLLVDIDLAILGAAEQRFAEYEHQIRAEYFLVPSDLFRQKRQEILCAFLARPRIFSTTYFYTNLEEQARFNLARANDQL